MTSVTTLFLGCLGLDGPSCCDSRRFLLEKILLYNNRNVFADSSAFWPRDWPRVGQLGWEIGMRSACRTEGPTLEYQTAHLRLSTIFSMTFQFLPRERKVWPTEPHGVKVKGGRPPKMYCPEPPTILAMYSSVVSSTLWTLKRMLLSAS